MKNEMKKEIRKPKKNDQKNAEKAFQLIVALVYAHPKIEPNIWLSACWSLLVHNYIQMGFTYQEFGGEWDQVKENYKSWWEKG